MEISPERLNLALGHLKPSDWEHFERLASAFLVSEYPEIRTMASAGGDGGRDAELVFPSSTQNVVIQYSIREAWAAKIQETVKRLQETFPNARILIFMSNQQIGAKADQIKKDLSDKGIFLDVRDKSWFVERTNSDQNRRAAAAEIARVIVDPFLESQGVIDRTTSALSGQDARTALFFLEMQFHDENKSKGLTKSSFEALVRAALHETASTLTMKRNEIYSRVAQFLPKHSPTELEPYIDGALRRLTKSAIRHVQKDDEFNLSHEEIERLKDRSAAIALLNEAFEVDVVDIVKAAGQELIEKQTQTAKLVHEIIGRYFLAQGEAFAASVARDADLPVDDASLTSIAIDLSPSTHLIKGRENVAFLMHVARTLLTNPSDATRDYLRLLSETYTLFAFLEEVPDVQKVTKKLFAHGEIWLDTSVLLPVFAEQAFPEGLRPFTALFRQARIGGVKLIVTLGVLEEMERHLNLCTTYNRSSTWNGRVPYVFARYTLAGRNAGAFQSWVEQFCGTHQPIQDIADYLFDTFGIGVEQPLTPDNLDTEIVSNVRLYWKNIQDNRRKSDGNFNMNANRLAEHDAENILSVLSDRKTRAGKSSLGYNSWLLTLDSAARKMLAQLDDTAQREIKHSPVISIDFLLKYLAFGPTRDRVDESTARMPYVFAEPTLEIPPDLLTAALGARSENASLPERIIQRRIRDALEREKLKAGPVQMAGLDGAPTAISEAFQ